MGAEVGGEALARRDGVISLEEASSLSPTQLSALSAEELVELAEAVQARRAETQQAQQLRLYEPVHGEARKVHLSTAREVVARGGNRSGKSEVMLAELAIQLTGVVPYALEGWYPREKLRTPIRARLVCTDFVTAWEPVLKPKLQWNRWNGAEEPGSGRGHWGWIPKDYLRRGVWEESWSEKYRTLTLVNGSSLQVMSYKQDVGDFSGASMHVVAHDEGPSAAIYRENRMRTMDVGGRCYIAYTPPDDERASWDAAWIYDELCLKGEAGPGKDPEIDAFEFWTEHNRTLSAADIQAVIKGLTPAQRLVRLRGQSMHLSGRIYPLYTDREAWWCQACGEKALVVEGVCATCESAGVVSFCHLVPPFEVPESWPVVYVLDPHPRKPHAMAWYAVDPSDDVWQVGELEVDGTPLDVREAVFAREAMEGWGLAKRVIDPNMGESPARADRRHRTWRDEFDAVGLRCDLADDNRTSAMQTIRTWLKPDPHTGAPRFRVFTPCVRTNFQMLRYVWGEHARYTADEHNPKPTPRPLHDDFPTVAGYFANLGATFRGLREGMQPRARRRVKAY